MEPNNIATTLLGLKRVIKNSRISKTQILNHVNLSDTQYVRRMRGYKPLMVYELISLCDLLEIGLDEVISIGTMTTQEYLNSGVNLIRRNNVKYLVNTFKCEGTARASAFSRKVNVSKSLISDIVNGKKPLSTKTAIHFESTLSLKTGSLDKPFSAESYKNKKMASYQINVPELLAIAKDLVSNMSKSGCKIDHDTLLPIMIGSTLLYNYQNANESTLSYEICTDYIYESIRIILLQA